MLDWQADGAAGAETRYPHCHVVNAVVTVFYPKLWRIVVFLNDPLLSYPWYLFSVDSEELVSTGKIISI